VAAGYAAAMTKLDPGDLAPDFHATDTEGHALHLAQLVKKGPVILAFFPRAFTPG
jgi:peroxiredoxin Q/BCP